MSDEAVSILRLGVGQRLVRRHDLGGEVVHLLLLVVDRRLGVGGGLLGAGLGFLDGLVTLDDLGLVTGDGGLQVGGGLGQVGPGLGEGVGVGAGLGREALGDADRAGGGRDGRALQARVGLERLDQRVVVADRALLAGRLVAQQEVHEVLPLLDRGVDQRAGARLGRVGAHLALQVGDVRHGAVADDLRVLAPQPVALGGHLVQVRVGHDRPDQKPDREDDRRDQGGDQAGAGRLLLRDWGHMETSDKGASTRVSVIPGGASVARLVTGGRQGGKPRGAGGIVVPIYRRGCAGVKSLWGK
jgi:hypothetical protein